MWRRWKAGQGKLCFVSCSHQRASAGKYLFPQTQQGLQFVQLSARTQNDGPRLLAQKLPERDNQPRIIDGPERVRNITSLFRCFTVMSDRSDHPSVPTYLRRPSCFSVRLERRFSVPACNLTERWSQRRSREARSRAEPRAAASLRRALDLDGPLRPAQRLIRLGASELPLPLPTIPTARREAEAGSPSKSVTTTPSIAVILLTVSVACGCTTASPTRNVLFRTVPAFCAPLIGSNSDSRAATLPNGASAAYRAVTYASSGAMVAASRSSTAKLFASPELWQGQASRRRTRTGTSPNSERNVTP